MASSREAALAMPAAGLWRRAVGPLNRALRRLPPWGIYLLAVLMAASWFWRALTGTLGPDPARALELQYGDWALQTLIATLAVTPLLRFAGIRLMHLRRALGVASFFFAFMHLSVWLFLDMQLLWPQIVSDIARRPYITLGMTAFALMLPLWLTSNNAAIRRLGRNWKRLHRLVWPVAVLAAFHFVLVVKGLPLRPFVYAALIAALLALRLVPRRGG